LIVPLMTFRPTRVFGLILSIAFHLSNIMMFGLATFPWFSLLLTTMFFDPSWPRKIPIIRKFMPWGIERYKEYSPNPVLLSLLAAYVLIHALLPFRHLLYPGVTSWTEEGQMFAWRMMLRYKQGQVHFFIQDKISKKMIRADLKEHITQNQYIDMVGKPDMILQLAHYLKDHYERTWNSEVSVFASSRISFNGRPTIEMIQPGVDLGLERRSVLPYQWIRPLNESVQQTALSKK
jgi:vitamin K-dependent gamma-carboxylase